MMLNRRQVIQLQLIDVDESLQRLARAEPKSVYKIDRIRSAIGDLVFLLNDVDLKKFCGLRRIENNKDGGAN
jgi:hypothetical protein